MDNLLELKENYIKKLREFEDLLEFAVEVSNQTAGQLVDAHLGRASQLYIRLTMTSMSIIHLLPYNIKFPTQTIFWDYISVASLARNLLENYHMFYYVAIEKVSDDERKFRLSMLNYHTNCEKYKLYRDWKVEQEVLEEFEKGLPLLKEELRTYPFFAKIEEKKGKEILKGKDAMILSHKEISKRIHFDTSEFIYMYRFLSNQTHSTPFASFSLSETRGRGAENQAEIEYINLALDLCYKYLSAAVIDMTGIFPECISKLDNMKLESIKQGFAEYLKE